MLPPELAKLAEKDHPLAPHTTFGIGGPAQYFIHSKTPDQFLHILKLIHQTNLKDFTILGHGSNVLISDLGLPGLVIKNDFRTSDPPWRVDTFPSGVDLQTLIKTTLNNNLIGLEQFAYIPATLGGAIISNIHGFDKSNFNQYLDTIQVFNLQTGQVENLKATDLSWGYDHSPFQSQPHLIILSATLKLHTGDGQSALATYQTIFDTKKQSQPFPSAGCIFKNPNDDSAGRIIDQDLGLKGYSIGGAKISEKHANFIVNTGTATASDVYQLITYIQSQAHQKLTLTLELEIRLLGQFK